MPILTLALVPEGPVVDLMVGVSVPRAEAMRRAGQQVPPPVLIKALVDTGASCTCIVGSLLAPLGLTPTGQIGMNTPSTGPTPATCSQYDVSLTIIHPALQLQLGVVPIVECQSLFPSSVQGLFGRDLLAHCMLVYDGQAQRFSLAF